MHNPGRHKLATNVFITCEIFFGLRTVFTGVLSPHVFGKGVGSHENHIVLDHIFLWESKCEITLNPHQWKHVDFLLKSGWELIHFSHTHKCMKCSLILLINRRFISAYSQSENWQGKVKAHFLARLTKSFNVENVNCWKRSLKDSFMLWQY